MVPKKGEKERLVELAARNAALVLSQDKERIKKEELHVVIEGAEFADYFWPAVEQYVECTHEYWRSNGKFAPNITLRLASGGYIGGGLYHSQNITS